MLPKLTRLFLFIIILNSIVFATNNARIMEIANTSYHQGQFTKAYRLWLKLAQDGDASAQNNIGELFLNGKGVPKNIDKATYWFKKSADQGNDDAKTSLGYIYYYHKNDKVKAAALWKEAAQNGNQIAQQNLVNAGINVAIDASKKILSTLFSGGGGGFPFPGLGSSGGGSSSSSPVGSNKGTESSRCKHITNSTFRNMCRAFTTGNQSYCRDIGNSDWRDYCRSRIYGSKSYCRSISDDGIQSLCYGRCVQIKIASSSRNQDLRKLCQGTGCYHIRDSNLRELCRALKN